MSTFKETKVDGSYLQSCATQIDDKISAVNTALTRLDTIVATLNAGWEGEANKLFMANHTSSKEYSGKWLDACWQLSDTLKKCGQSYNRADDDVMAKVRAFAKR